MEQAQNNSSPSRNELNKAAKAQEGSPLHLALLKYLADEQLKANRTLVSASDPVALYRAQGDVERINKLVGLLKAQ
jgi:hypothetical protein